MLFEDGHAGATLCQSAGGGKAGEAGADYGDVNHLGDWDTVVNDGELCGGKPVILFEHSKVVLARCEAQPSVRDLKFFPTFSALNSGENCSFAPLDEALGYCESRLRPSSLPSGKAGSDRAFYPT